MQALTVWLTGLPSAGKSTLGSALAERLREAGHRVEVLDGDAVRSVLSKGLGFSQADREENIRRVGWVADLLSRNGIFAVCSLISPYRAVRDELRAAQADRFFEVHVAAPLEICVRRDVKGLYARQRAGAVKGLTGIDDPYEAPLQPDLSLPTHELSLDESVDRLLCAMAKRMGPFERVKSSP